MIKEVHLDIFLDTPDDEVEMLLTLKSTDGTDNMWYYYRSLDKENEVFASLQYCNDVWRLASVIASEVGVVCRGSLSSTYDISIDDYDIVIDELGKLNEKYHTEITNGILKEQIYGDEVFDYQ